MTAWKPSGPATTVDPDTVVLIEGSSFCISDPVGDIAAEGVNGLFIQDTRVLSRWDVHINDERIRLLVGLVPEPYHGLYLGLAPTIGEHRQAIVVERHRWIGKGMREVFTVRNFAREPAECTIAIAFEADFADVFEVKDGRVPRRTVEVSYSGEHCTMETIWRGHHRAVVLEAPGATMGDGRALFRGVVPGHGSWEVVVGATVVLDGVELPRLPLDQPIEESAPVQRLREWRFDVPTAHAENPLVERVLRRSQRDLGSLRIVDPSDPDSVVVAAGAPWFMALFGRDSLLTALMALPLDQQLAVGTMRTLARYQGARFDPLTEEEPGRIVHEIRFGLDAASALGGERTYYGTVDATPLFVILLAELHQWGIPAHDIAMLMPHADRAMDWIRHIGDRDGDGFVEYQRATEHGLANQGWKDSWDGINFADGSIAQAPIALCEVQGYVYAAYRARARLAGDTGERDIWLKRADELKRAFNETFWLPDRGYYAVALDGDKRAVDGCASNMGHCLMTGIADRDKAAGVVQHLMSERMFTGWGVRTLASDMGAYNPASYHNGSVWPHDNAVIATGLRRYGYVAAAQRITTALLDAAEHFDARLPELFCGFDRAEYPTPIPYPTSCSPQAWAAASPIHLVRVLLGFEPAIPDGAVRLAPAWPKALGDLELRNLKFAGNRMSVSVEKGRVSVNGLPAGVELRCEPADDAGA
jgi:glycogen debranching enzyme